MSFCLFQKGLQCENNGKRQWKGKRRNPWNIKAKNEFRKASLCLALLQCHKGGVFASLSSFLCKCKIIVVFAYILSIFLSVQMQDHCHVCLYLMGILNQSQRELHLSGTRDILQKRCPQSDLINCSASLVVICSC